MKKITIIISALIIFTLNAADLLAAGENQADQIRVNNASGEIYAVPGETAYGTASIDIPEGLYIYANPKGPGIGRATELAIEKNRILKEWEARYPEGTKYQAKGDPDPVYIYRKNVRIPFALVLKNGIAAGNYRITAKVSVLMCSDSACIPAEKNVVFNIKVPGKTGVSSGQVTGSLNEFLSLRKNTDTSAPDTGSNQVTGPVINDGDKTVIPEEIVFTPRYPDGSITGIFKAILFGLIAGFVLNFMPCVLPVVSLKIMSFVTNAGEKRSVVITQGFVFSAGIMASFMVLAALAAFSGYKWGALFQERFFIIIMASFIFAMGLSLFGVFTFNVPFLAVKAVSKQHGIYTDAFIKGAVATLLATPCSGPFLGGTLAWTLTKPPQIVFVIFMSVGFGMALPYILIVLNPRLMKMVPKPGEWTLHFEKAMGFLLMFTVVYLLGILDDTVKVRFVFFLLFLSIALWQFGTFGSPDKDRRSRMVSFTVLVAVTAAGYFLSFSSFSTGGIVSHERYPFSAERILRNRDNGIISVVEFTADWCPNCSLVEKVALGKDEVQKIFARDDVDFIVADITRMNPAAESLMKRLGSRSIPLLAVIPPGDGFSSPVCLRDIYSAGDVVDAVSDAGKRIQKKQGVRYDSK